MLHINIYHHRLGVLRWIGREEEVSDAEKDVSLMKHLNRFCCSNNYDIGASDYEFSNFVSNRLLLLVDKRVWVGEGGRSFIKYGREVNVVDFCMVEQQEAILSLIHCWCCD